MSDSDEDQNEINYTFVLFFLAILYSVVFVISCIRIIPYLFAKSKRGLQAPQNVSPEPLIQANTSPISATSIVDQHSSPLGQQPSIVRSNSFQAKRIKYTENITQIITQKSQILVEENEIRPIEFKLFYWMDLIQLFFLSIVYWLLAINLDYFKTFFDNRDPSDKTDSKSEEIGFSLILILLKFIPNIFLTLNYMLLYF